MPIHQVHHPFRLGCDNRTARLYGGRQQPLLLIGVRGDHSSSARTTACSLVKAAMESAESTPSISMVETMETPAMSRNCPVQRIMLNNGHGPAIQ